MNGNAESVCICRKHAVQNKTPEAITPGVFCFIQITQDTLVIGWSEITVRVMGSSPFTESPD